MEKKTKKLPADFWRNPVNFVALGFGCGLSPIMPGTCGTIAAIPIYFILHYLPLKYYLLILAIMIIAGFIICDVVEKRLGVKDHPAIVWDEIVGYLTTMLAAPFSFFWVIGGFILFRIFDILKPWPINLVNKNMQGGLAVMLDDLAAGVYAWIVLHIIGLFI